MSTTSLSTAIAASESSVPQVSPLALFCMFSRITLSAFGGMQFWVRQELVERRRWLTEQEFVELLALGQFLPGPNILNLSVMVGYRFAGWRGAAASVAGFVGWPFLIGIALGALHLHYGTLPLVQRALAGMSAVVAGLGLAMVFKMARVLPRRRLPWLFGILTFVSVGILRWPLLTVASALAPLAIVVAWKGKN